MTNHSGTFNYTISGNAPPVVAELKAVFHQLPDDDLVRQLRGPTRRGPKGHDPLILWRCYLAYYYLGMESVSALIRLLYDNPFVAKACGIDSPEQIPSQPTFSRFGTRLARKAGEFILAIKNILRGLTRKLYDTFPGFGKSVAIDSTDIKAWSNAGKKGKKRKEGKPRQKPLLGKVSDPDAGWCVKTNTEGRKKYTWGYKVHILCDADSELPLTVDISPGNLHDVKKATPLLSQARYALGGQFRPEHVICDAGYSSDKLRRSISQHYWAEPIIDPNPGHKRAFKKLVKTPEWKATYNKRGSVERLNGRLKAHRKLNHVRVRGRSKIRVHAMLAVIVCQAQALATRSRNSVRKVA